MTKRFVDNFCTYGFGMFERHGCGQDLRKMKDMAINLEMERYYAQSKRILIENRELLDKLARALIEKKTLLRRDIAEIKASCVKLSA